MRESLVDRNLLLRIISALVALPIILFLFEKGGWATYGFMIFVGVIAAGEYGTIVSPEDLVARRFFMAVASITLALAMLVTTAIQGLLLVHCAAIAFGIFFTLRTGDMATTWVRLSTLYFGVIYVAVAVSMFYRLRMVGEGLSASLSTAWIYWVFIATWSNDICAYFAGRRFGRHKLYEKVSPKKTWEGAFGGAVGTFVALFFFRYVSPAGWFDDFTVVDLVFIALPTIFLAPVGDLCESLLKRSYNAKDSGGIMPGHGGFLDRLDAGFFVAPWVLFYAAGLRPLLSS